MDINIIGTQNVREFRTWLVQEEKSAATVEKYLRDVQAFQVYAKGRGVTKDLVMAWKESLVAEGYAARSINSMLASVNSLLKFLGLDGCRVKNLKIQQQAYCPEEKELTKAEYKRLLDTAAG